MDEQSFRTGILPDGSKVPHGEGLRAPASASEVIAFLDSNETRCVEAAAFALFCRKRESFGRTDGHRESWNKIKLSHQGFWLQDGKRVFQAMRSALVDMGG